MKTHSPAFRFFGPTEKALYLSRPNRFVLTCELRGKTVQAFLPNPGRLSELLLPDTPVYLEKTSNPNRSLHYTAVALERDGLRIVLHTHKTNEVARHLTDVNLGQSEADALIAMEKYRINEAQWDYPSLGGAVSIPLRSEDKREEFFLDISRGKIDLKKTKYQNRARHVVVLVRADLGGPPHRNPDDTEVATPHLHLYWEGFGDKWAKPLPSDSFSDAADR